MKWRRRPGWAMGEEEGFEDVQSDGPKSVQEKCRKEREAEEEERRAGMRCHQEQREISENQPSELDAAAPVITDSLLSLVSLHCTPHQSFDSVDFDLELTAEVRLEDGSSLAFLSSVTPRFHSPKHHLGPSAFNTETAVLSLEIQTGAAILECNTGSQKPLAFVPLYITIFTLISSIIPFTFSIIIILLPCWDSNQFP
ncbi:hypothetical protein JZ751_026325 [Albula glossodonta]|uniref:Uncharacterized protein n=1 Tax=Albula glossodonta TaxID=121402 RepID=A0A8T2PJZ0_9TELE|nr:hypothetical protein JZ751_026325 [Albula glossodonta]